MKRLILTLVLSFFCLSAQALGIGADLGNPGNIKYNVANDWMGRTEVRQHDIYESFDDIVYGFRAMHKVLQTYHRDYGITNIAGIILRYAPPEHDGNNTANYIMFVATELNIPATHRLDFSDYDEMADLMIAMTYFENGGFKDEWYSALDCGLISNGVVPKEEIGS